MSLVFLHPQEDIVQQLIVDLGLGSLPAVYPSVNGSWPIYVSSEPDTPDNVITVYNTVGQNDGREMINGEVFEHYGFMVRVRASTGSSAFLKAAAIAHSFSESVHNNLVSLDGAIYLVCAVNIRGSLIDTGKESPSSERDVFTINAVSAIYRTT